MVDDNTIEEMEYESKPLEMVSKKELLREPIEKEPYLPYREKLHSRKEKGGKTYWHRTRSNPQLR